MYDLNSKLLWIKSYVFDKPFPDPVLRLTKPFAFLRNSRYKTTKPEKKKEKVENRSTSRGSGGRNRSRSGSQLNAKHCPICCLPSCENRGKQVGSCPELPQVRYNPANYCQTCYMIGHFSCGDQCKEVSKKRANMMLGN